MAKDNKWGPSGATLLFIVADAALQINTDQVMPLDPQGEDWTVGKRSYLLKEQQK
ncbi:MAG: hypothetical protein ABIP79_06005 [Chitinophagaceae bacterium]